MLYAKRHDCPITQLLMLVSSLNVLITRLIIFTAILSYKIKEGEKRKKKNNFENCLDGVCKHTKPFAK